MKDTYRDTYAQVYYVKEQGKKRDVKVNREHLNIIHNK